MGPSHTAGKKYRGQTSGARVKIKPRTINKPDGLVGGSEVSVSDSDAGVREERPKISSTRSDVMKIPGSTVAKARMYPGHRSHI
jgi:hypothetical protein